MIGSGLRQVRRLERLTNRRQQEMLGAWSRWHNGLTFYQQMRLQARLCALAEEETGEKPPLAIPVEEIRQGSDEHQAYLDWVRQWGQQNTGMYTNFVLNASKEMGFKWGA